MTVRIRVIGAGIMGAHHVTTLHRFDPGYRELRVAIDRGRIGAPVLVHNVNRGVSSGPNATSESSIVGTAIHETFLNSASGYVMRCEVVGETGAISLAEPARVVLDADRITSMREGGRLIRVEAS